MVTQPGISPHFIDVKSSRAQTNPIDIYGQTRPVSRVNDRFPDEVMFSIPSKLR